MKRGLLLLAMMCGVWGWAQRTKIYGVVKSGKGEAVELATVRVAGKNVLTLTNLKGEYALRCERADSVVLVFAQVGYGTRRKLLTGLGDSMRVDMTLHELDRSLGTAVVRGKQKQTTAMERIGTKPLEQLAGASGNVVEELIQSQAGVSTHNELSSQYNVRGGSFDENVVYVNGFEVFRPFLVRSGQQEGLSIINPDMVEQIRFSSGGFAAEYGDKMSSVLAIRYKRPEGLEAKVGGGMLGGGGYVGWGNKRVSVMGSVRYKTTKYLLGTLDTEGEYAPKFLDYQGYMCWRPNVKWSVEALGNVSDNRYEFAPASRETSFGTLEDPKTFKVYFDGGEKDQFRTYFGALSVKRMMGGRNYAALQFSTFSTKEEEYYDISGEYWLQEATEQEQLGIGRYMEHARNRLKARVMNVGGRWHGEWGMGGTEGRKNRHVVDVGVNVRGERIEEHTAEWEMRDSMGYSLPVSDKELALIYSMRSDQRIEPMRLGAFAQDAWRRKTGRGLLNVTYGMRYTYYSWNKQHLLSPRVSVGFLPEGNDKWTLRMATGVYYQPPFYKELKDTVKVEGVTRVRLNRHAMAQRAVHVVAGADYTFRWMDRPFQFTAEAYYKALANLNPYTVNNMRVVYMGQNVGKGYVAGLDLKLYGEFVPGTDSWITLSVMKAEERANGVKLPQPTDQRYNFSMFFTDYFPGSTRWKASLRAAFAGGLPFGPPHSAQQRHTFRAPAYKRVDLGLNYRVPLKWQRNRYDVTAGKVYGKRRWVKNVWLGVDCFNLLDIQNVNSYYWVTDITNTRYAVPNFLTGRQLNVRFSVEF